MRLRKVSPDLVDRDKPLIDDIGRRINDPDLFTRIHEALLKRRAFLFQSEDFFVVLAPHPDYMLGWVAGSHSKELNFSRLRSYLKEVERLVLIGGCRVMRTLSVRSGWEKIYGKAGYTCRKEMIDGFLFDVWEKGL